jgi:hypothetical protein
MPVDGNTLGWKPGISSPRILTRKVYKEISDLISNMISDLIFAVVHHA